MIRLFISAAEISSDAHAAELLKSLRKLASPQLPVEAFGVGGTQLAKQSFESWIDASEFLAMGFSEIVHKLPSFYRNLVFLEKKLKERPCDLAILIDYPDFHFRLAKRLKKRGIPVIYYIPPKVWVWRKNRLQFLKKNIEKVLCILPFEKDWYDQEGVSAKYVGNPLLDELPIQLSQEQARQQLHLEKAPTSVTFMPGSRPAELKVHFELGLDILLHLAQRLKAFDSSRVPLVVLVPLVEGTSLDSYQKRYEQWFRQREETRLLDVRFSVGNAALCLKASHLGLIKSGTSTLEAALLGCPHVIFYQCSEFSWFLYRHLVRYLGPIGLSNLIGLDAPIARLFGKHPSLPFPEFKGSQIPVSEASEALFQLLTDSSTRQKTQAAMARVQGKLQPPSGPQERLSASMSAASEVLATFYDLKSRQYQQDFSVPVSQKTEPSLRRSWQFLQFLGSLAWSTLNQGIRLGIRLGIFRPKLLGPSVISIGNIVVGGAGKTPLVALVAKEAIEKGYEVGILTRGYQGRFEKKGSVIHPFQPAVTAQDYGDEAALLHDLVPQAWIGVGAKRYQQYLALKRLSGKDVDVVVLDDGFQHWRIHKDIEVVALTSHRFTEKLHRDFPSALKQADIGVWTKGDEKPQSPERQGLPLIHLEMGMPAVLSASQKNVWLITALGDPHWLVAQLEKREWKVRTFFFKDHYGYQEESLLRFFREAKKENTLIVTTGKDWVKWREWLQPVQGLASVEALSGHVVDVKSRAGEIFSLMVLEPKLKILPEESRLWNETLWARSY